ncbi:MAG: GNAT family N-acetyltransferase [Bdellovibrionaceae bacterium]|nr:GNAT family N-acetyltransferase [Pseudobdellovibrionaceae bacterium]
MKASDTILKEIMNDYSQYILSKEDIFESHDGLIDANYTKFFKSVRIAVHWVKLLPKQRSSCPHAESLEEEFIYVVSGRPHVWINGFIYQLEPGHAVGFPAGTGIAHCFLNNTDLDVEMIVLGERTKKENKCSYPINHELKKSRNDIWWNECPKQSLGGHDGAIGNLNFLRDIDEISFIKNVKNLKRSKSFSYNGDNETFSSGIRLTDYLSLKAVGVWHELMQNGKRSSWPHAHSQEEEFAIILKGEIKVWLNGNIYHLKPGDCVYFKPGTNMAHTLINESDDPVEFLGIGESGDLNPTDKIFYPLHETRNQECITENFLWEDVPEAYNFGSNLGIPFNKNIKVQEFQNAQEFLYISQADLYQKEAEHGLMLGLTEIKVKNPTAKDDNIYFRIEDPQGFLGYAVVTDKNFIISAMPASLLRSLIIHLNENKIKSAGVVGPSHSSETFARIYSYVCGVQYKIGMDQKIYQLDQVIPARPCEGKMIVTMNEHLDLAVGWLLNFIKESMPHEPTTLENARDIIKTKLDKQELFMWQNAEGVPVALNMVMRPTRNGIAVSFVYTPKDQRMKGYASALVAQTSQRMLDAGKKFCVLYTDATNPTSNGVYQKIGYNQIATSKNFIFLK